MVGLSSERVLVVLVSNESDAMDEIEEEGV